MQRYIQRGVIVFLLLLAVLPAASVLAYGNTTVRVNVSSAGDQTDYSGGRPSISDDGRFIAFEGGVGIFVYDRQNGTAELVSVDSAGNPANDASQNAAISGNGRFVAFESYATNLTENPPAYIGVYVHDRQTGLTEVVGVNSTGQAISQGASAPSISADGRFIAFETADPLVQSDTNQTVDVYVLDRQNGTTELVSVDSAGNQSNYASTDAAISADGHFVAFVSYAANLVPGDTNDERDVFVHDLQRGTTERVSVSTSGDQANNASLDPAISGDGRMVVFMSVATNLVPGEPNYWADTFVRDRLTGTTRLVNVDRDGNPVMGAGIRPAISRDGRFVAFDSDAANMVPGDTNNAADVFIYDLQTGVARLMSVDSAGNQANYGAGSAYAPAINADGHVVVFESWSTNLVPGDTNNIPDLFAHEWQALATPPAAPSRPDLDASSDSGSSETDNLTNNILPVFIGTADAAASVIIYVDDVEQGRGDVVDGAYRVPAGRLSDGSHHVTAVAVDASGQRSQPSAMLDVIIDTAPPATTITSMPRPATNVAVPQFRFAAEAGAFFACALSSSPDGYRPCLSPQSYGPLVDGSYTFYVRAADAAGNVGAPVSATFTLDTKAPSMTLGAPAAGTYLLNQSVLASYSCADESGGSGLASCGGTAPNGSPVATASVGTQTFAVKATDRADNTASHSINFSVAYQICALYDQNQSHRRGSAIPIKLQICDSTGINASSAEIIVHATGVSKLDSTASDTIANPVNLTPDTDFRYDSTLSGGGGYRFNLSTKDKLYSTGTWALSFTITGDPSTHTVGFDVR
jgi:hypothetical protein